MGSHDPGAGAGDPGTEGCAGAHGGRGRSFLEEMKTAEDGEVAEDGKGSWGSTFFPFLSSDITFYFWRFYVSSVIPLRPQRPLRS